MVGWRRRYSLLVNVRGGTDLDADRRIDCDPALCKTAWFGADPNGRILCAVIVGFVDPYRSIWTTTVFPLCVAGEAGTPRRIWLKS